jgi:hypothetical protein
MVVRLVATGVLAALSLSSNVSAQEISTAADSSPETEAVRVNEEVIVRGRRLSEIEFDLRIYIRDFLEEVTLPSRGRGYARWHRKVCIGVHNLENSAAQYIIDRISGLALEVGLEPGEPGCDPQVNIIFATDAGEMAARMVEAEPRVFRPIAGYAGMDRGIEGLDYFVASEAAVRWWHVSLPVDARTGNPAIQTANVSCPRSPNCFPVFFVDGPSRVHSGVRDDLQYVIILVDATKLTGTTWQQLSDYLSLVTLAQIDLNTDPAEFDSILNLFSNPAAYSGLTDWDRQYIHALYRFNPERGVRIQGNEIVSRIAKRELSATD